ncbi:MAG: hypothetical protein KF724_11650 [Phycisphaeraceae bacterium]|nr:hypothetical protein [Phycisphaeraceae bacterium]
MHGTHYPSEPVPLNVAARCLRVPARLLREQIDAGRLPALRAGRVVLVDVYTIARILLARARQEQRESDGTSGGAA